MAARDRSSIEALSGRLPGPGWAWVAGFVACVAADATLGRWVVLPVFVVGFYGGVVAIELATYPLLGRWRALLRRHGPRAWYLAVIGGLWAGPALVLASSSPLWLAWGWEGVTALRLVGALALVSSVGIGSWAMGKMGWARLLLAPALFSPGDEPEERVPRRLVVEGPYRHARHPLYGADLGVILGTASLTGKWAPVVLAGAYAAVLGPQLRLEERELEARFGEAYARYRRLVPGLVPRLGPVDLVRVHGPQSKEGTDEGERAGRAR
ncbi:MAG: isoprenylcysteine carboxylmethyltransferase family protein [Actinomycetota bacterium]|nr:isoprenylcysteine carboxylmethyltransferase family protein [Actinomycetota bacterium]